MENIDINKVIMWDLKFETGIPRIDLEHKIFLELFNSYRVAILKNKDDSELNKIINVIEKYAEFHFTSEETFMAEIKYPGLNNHQHLHFDLLEKLNIAKHKSNNSLEFLQFAFDWFSHHTTHEDKSISNFIKKNNIQAEYYLNI
ncbi:MAG TPA: hemerythrin domain-containing protein [Flavobacteriaceae bacterium]|nr:hemerythrin domain-containing protein [Flavobacteriaceae bacterium]